MYYILFVRFEIAHFELHVLHCISGLIHCELRVLHCMLRLTHCELQLYCMSGLTHCELHELYYTSTHSSSFISPPPTFFLRDVDACWVPLEEIKK